jgi:hypothetical protein
LSIVIKILSNQQFELWDRFVDEHPQGTVFHTTNWLRLVNPEIEIFTAWDNDQLMAGVALIKTRKNSVNGYHIPSYTQYFSPLYINAGNRKGSLTEEHTCIQALLHAIRNDSHLDFKLPRGHQSILPYHWDGFETSVSITHTITGTLEEYLSGLNKNKLRELKKLQSMVNTGELSIEEKVQENELAKLMEQTELRKGFDSNAVVAARLIMETGDGVSKKVLIRSKAHGPIAFGFFPYDKKAVYNLINASVRISDPVLKTVNLLLLYTAIEFALTTGRTFDFEGSMLPGVETFCRLMGGTQVPVYRVQKSGSLKYSLLRAAKQIKNDRKKA